MRKLVALIGFLFVLGGTQTAQALSMESMDGHKTKSLADYIGDYLTVPDDALDWKILGKTEIIEIDQRDSDGMDIVYDKPKFTPEVKALNGKKVRVKGFMFPLEETDEQKEFLVGPFPASCPFQYHVGPNLVIEVYAEKNPVAFSYDPIMLEGTLELVPDDPDYSTFYRLRDARLVKE